MEETVKRFVDLQRAFLKSISDQQTAFINQQTDVLTSFSKQQTAFLTSMSEILWSANSQKSDNKVQDKDLVMKKGEEKVTNNNDEVMYDNGYLKQLTESSSAPWHPSSRLDEKKYRLHIVGKVSHDETVENGRLKMIVFRGRPITVEVILKHGDEQVPASHHLASLRVELVVLDAKCPIEELTDWSPKEFEDHFMKVSKNGTTGMTVARGIFSLDGGRKVHSVASINESSWKQKVKLGVMVVQDGSVQERVLEGMSSNEFYVIHERRADSRQTTGISELNTNGKRLNIKTTQPSTSYSQCSGHVQSAQQFNQHGHHGMGEQPSHAPNAWPTQNHPTTPLGIILLPVGIRNILMTIVWKIVNELLPPALSKFEGKNPIHRNLQGLRAQLHEFHCTLQNGRTLGIDGIIHIFNSIRQVTGDADILKVKANSDEEVNSNEGGAVELATGLAELDAQLLRAMQHAQQLTSNQARQPAGYNGTAGGGQGQPSTPQVGQFLNNNLDTNSQGHITTAATTGLTSAQPLPPPVQDQMTYWTSGPQTYPRQTREINRSVLEEQQSRSHGLLRMAWNFFSAYLSISPLNILSGRLPPGMGGPAAGSGGQYGTVSWRPSYTLTPNSSWTSGWSPTYLGQTQDSNRNFEGYSFLSELENVYAYAAGEQIQTAYGASRRPASVHRLRHHKVSDYAPYVSRASPGDWQVINDDHARQVVNKLAEFIDQQLRLGTNNKWTMNNQQQDTRKEIRVVGPESSVVKQESQVWCGDGDKKGSTESLGQFVVVDFKASCVSKDGKKQAVSGDEPLFEQEIIEFSSVLVDAALGHLTSTFHTYVSPIKNPVLSRFCMEYNDITQEDVEYGAVMLSEALQMHKAWIEKNHGGGGGGGGLGLNLSLNSAVVVTWGDWDCRTMLKQECQRKELPIPDYFKRWINLKKPFVDRYGSDENRPPIHLLGVQEALQAADLKWEGPLKGGRSHARNKARLLSSLIQQGAKLAITSWLDPARRAGTESSSSSSGGTVN